MTTYDSIIVLSPGLSEEKIDGLLAKFEKKISDNGGEVAKTEKWGMKRLNFEFKKRKGVKDGFYALINFKGEGKTATALRDLYRIQEEVMRQIITKSKKEVIANPEEAVIFPDLTQEQPSGQPQ